MVTHTHHHFVPRFLLEPWHAPPDDKLTSFCWVNGRLVSHRYKAKSVAKETHLYSMGRSQPQPNVKAEKDFLGPHIDAPAALVHAKMLKYGVSDLSADDKKAWSPFLISLLLRGPTMMQHIREQGRDILSSELDGDPHGFLEVRGNEPEATLREWVEKYMPDVLDDLGVMTLPKLAFSERLNHALLNVTWGVRSVHTAKFDLLISDKPLIVGGSFAASFLVALPISPTKMFFALNNDETLANLKKQDHDLFVRSANLNTVVAAERYVYARNVRQESFVGKFLRPPHST